MTNAATEPNITIVTAFFDINRANWQVYARSVDTYFAWFANLATLANPMVVYTSPDLAERAMAVRDDAGFADLTTVVTIENFRAANAELRDAIIAIQESEAFQQVVLDRTLPKWWHPDYLLLGHLKPALVDHAISAGLVRTPLAAWVDFACCRDPRAVEGVDAWSFPFDPGKAHAFTRFPFDRAVPAELIVKHADPPVTADVVVASPEGWAALAEAWADRLARLIDQGLVDEAGALLMMVWQERPDLVELHDLRATGNPWLPAFRHFNEPVEGLPAPVRASSRRARGEEPGAAQSAAAVAPPAMGAPEESGEPPPMQVGIDRETAEDWDGAIAAYIACFDAAESPAEAGWAAYRAAAVLGMRLDDWESAEAACLRGIATDPSRPDLYWLAGYAAYQQDDPERAAAWARVAAALNHTVDDGLIPEHPGPLHEPARWDAPWDLLRYALDDLGDPDGAMRAGEQMALAPYRRAIVARSDRSGGGDGPLTRLDTELRVAAAEAYRRATG